MYEDRYTNEDLETIVKRALRQPGWEIALVAAMHKVYLRGMRDGRDDVRKFLAKTDRDAPDAGAHAIRQGDDVTKLAV